MSTYTEPYEALKPAFHDSDRCIVFAANASYMPLTSVAIKSIIDTSDNHETYDIIILHRDVGPEMQRKIRAMAEEAEHVSIRFYNMDAFTKATTFYVDNRPTLSAEAYFRLYIPWILSEEYHTALYLDGDMLITRNINEIFSHDLTGYQIAGVRDYWGIIYAYMPNHPRKTYRAGIGLTDFDNYIISSTILFHLDYFRKCHTIREVEKMIQARKWVQHDQDVVNVLCQGEILHLSPEWGMVEDFRYTHYLPDYLLEHLTSVSSVPAIAHYAGDWKPYAHADILLRDRFWETAERTPFFRELLGKIEEPRLKQLIIQRMASQYDVSPISVEGSNLYYNGIPIGSSLDDLYYRSIQICGNHLYIDAWCGQYDLFSRESVDVQMKVCDSYYEAYEHVGDDLFSEMDRFCYARGRIFRFDLDLSVFSKDYLLVEPFVRTDGIFIPCVNAWFEEISAVQPKHNSGYYHSEGWVIRPVPEGLALTRCSKKELLKREFEFCREIWTSEGIAGKKAVAVRNLSRLRKVLRRSQIWLFADDLNQNSDFSEKLAQYLHTHHPEVKLMFAVSGSDGSDASLRPYGSLIPVNTHKYKFLLLSADRILTSSSNGLFRSTFEDRWYLYSDIAANAVFVLPESASVSDEEDLGRLYMQIQEQR